MTELITFLIILALGFSPIWVPAGYYGVQSVYNHFFKKRKPEYAVVNYRGDYFPMKRKSEDEYDLVYEKTFGSRCWNSMADLEIALDYPNLHAKDSFHEAVEVIKDLDDVNLERVDGRYGIEWGTATYFDRPQNDDSNEKMTIDQMIDTKFTRDEIRDTKVGAERDLIQKA